MTDAVQATVTALYRYPIKGFPAQALQSAVLEVGQSLPFDRAFAIEDGPSGRDPNTPGYFKRAHFVEVSRIGAVSDLEVRFDDERSVLTLMTSRGDISSGAVRKSEDREKLERLVAQYLGDGLRGPPRIAVCPQEVTVSYVHIVNLASVRALADAMESKINPLRFRPNIVVDGLAPWSELALAGSKLVIGDVTLEVLEPTVRCKITNVEPDTGHYTMNIPAFLRSNYGHTDFGIYARVTTSGEIKVGDGAHIVQRRKHRSN